MHWGPRENKSRLFARLSVRVCVYVCVLPMCVHARVWKVKRLWHFRDPVRIFTQRRDVMAALERKKTAWANGSLQRIPSTQHHQEEERGCRRVYICLLVRFCAFKPDLRWKRFFWPPSIKLLEKKKKKGDSNWQVVFITFQGTLSTSATVFWRRLSASLPSTEDLHQPEQKHHSER